MDFVLHASIMLFCLGELVVSYFKKDVSLKEYQPVFLKRENLIFSVVVGSISFTFSFRLNSFTSKIFNSLFPLGAEETWFFGMAI